MTKLDFQPGDIVKMQGEVLHHFITGNVVEVRTVKGDTYLHTDMLEIVKRAPRKPKVGDRITGRQVCDTRWKRGTMLRNQAGDLLALNADAQWIPLGEQYPRAFSFADVLADEPDESQYEVVFLP